MTKTKRQGLSKKTRFEVFKRDGFLCQYCGAHPPAAVLVVDHITPVAGGGDNEMDNLATSCEPCNQGKSDRPLSSVSKSLAQKAAETAEREEQLLGYQRVMQERRDRLDQETWRIVDALEGSQTDTYSIANLRSIKMFLERIGFDEVLDAAELAYIAPVHANRMFRYFCGVCWKRIKGPQ